MSIKKARLAIILVGTDVSEDGKTLSPQSQAITEKGMLLAIQNICDSPFIICSGGNRAKKAPEGSLTESELIYTTLMKAFQENTISFPQQNILLENTSKNTCENAINTLKIINAWEQENTPKIDQFIIVSWKPHSGRVRKVFQAFINLSKKQVRKVSYITVDAPFGKNGENSQKRLTSAFYWYIWNYLCAYEATFFIILQEFVRSRLGFKQR